MLILIKYTILIIFCLNWWAFGLSASDDNNNNNNNNDNNNNIFENNGVNRTGTTCALPSRCFVAKQQGLGRHPATASVK